MHRYGVGVIDFGDIISNDYWHCILKFEINCKLYGLFEVKGVG
jgi:hypothetical protein